MRIIVKHNIDKKVYHAYIPMVDYSADIPEEAYAGDRVFDLLRIYSKDKVSVDIQPDLDSSKGVVMTIKATIPKNGVEYLSCIRGFSEYDLNEYPYLTVDYTGKVFVHKDYPYRDFGDSDWSSEIHEPIGYLPETILIENDGLLEDESNYVYDTVYKCLKDDDIEEIK